MDPPAVSLQPLGKMPHGAEQQNQFLLVVIGVAGFVMDFRHYHHVLILVSVIKCADIRCQLVAEYQNQVRHSFGDFSLQGGKQNTP